MMGWEVALHFWLEASALAQLGLPEAPAAVWRPHSSWAPEDSRPLLSGCSQPPRHNPFVLQPCVYPFLPSLGMSHLHWHHLLDSAIVLERHRCCWSLGCLFGISEMCTAPPNSRPHWKQKAKDTCLGAWGGGRQWGGWWGREFSWKELLRGQGSPGRPPFS